MAIGNEWWMEMKKAIENGEDEKMFQLFIYNYMKSKNLHDVAEILAQEANLEISQLARCEESLLTEWWELFWPSFFSRLSNKAGANVQSSGQQSMVNAMAAEPLLVAEAFGNERLPPVGSQSHLQLPATMETLAQVTEDPKDYGLGWSDEMELTRRQNSTIVVDHAGEASNNQLPLTGLGVVPGPDLLSYESHVPDAFLQFIRQAMHIAGSSQPPRQSSGREFSSERNE